MPKNSRDIRINADTAIGVGGAGNRIFNNWFIIIRDVMFLYNTASRILFVNKLSVGLVFNIPSGIKKLFKFLKKYSYRS